MSEKRWKGSKYYTIFKRKQREIKLFFQSLIVIVNEAESSWLSSLSTQGFKSGNFNLIIEQIVHFDYRIKCIWEQWKELCFDVKPILRSDLQKRWSLPFKTRITSEGNTLFKHLQESFTKEWVLSEQLKKFFKESLARQCDSEIRQFVYDFYENFFQLFSLNVFQGDRVKNDLIFVHEIQQIK